MEILLYIASTAAGAFGGYLFFSMVILRKDFLSGYKRVDLLRNDRDWLAKELHETRERKDIYARDLEQTREEKRDLEEKVVPSLRTAIQNLESTLRAVEAERNHYYKKWQDSVT